MTSTDFEDALSALLKAASAQRTLKTSAEFQKAIKAVSAHPDYDPVKLADALPDLDSAIGAGFIGVWLGAGVEDGRDPELTGRQIARTFLKWSRGIETPPLADDDEEEEDEEDLDFPEPDEEIVAGLKLLGQALVAHLARSPSLLNWVRDTDAILAEFERVEAVSIGAVWVLYLLRQCSGDLVALEMAERRGFLVRYDNLTNCFHLFTLLQGALASRIGREQETRDDVLEIARGNQDGDGEGYDHAWWHYGQPSGSKPDVGATVWGEMEPDGIEVVDGVRVLLLWPPIMESRTWDAGFFAPVIHASLPNVIVIEELAQPAVDSWWVRLGLPSA
jgi:hypothetical protein